MDQAMSPPARPLLVRRRQPPTSPRRSPYRQSSRAPSPRARSSRAQSSRAQSSRAQSSRAQSPRASRAPLQLTPRPGASSRRDSRSPTPRRMDSRSRTPPATAAKAKPRPRSSSSSSTLLRPAATGEDRYKTPAMPSTFKFPKNIAKYEVDWSAIEVERYPVQDGMKAFVQTLASSAKFKITGGVLLEHNPSWDRGLDATEETMRRYYYLVSSDLALKDPPLPTKSERILFWSHATDVGSLWSMLRNRDMLPMSAHGVSQFGCNIFYALGHPPEDRGALSMESRQRTRGHGYSRRYRRPPQQTWFGRIWTPPSFSWAIHGHYSHPQHR